MFPALAAANLESSLCHCSIFILLSSFTKMSKVCDEKVWISTLPSPSPLHTGKFEMFRGNYLAAAATGIDTKCEAI